MTALAVRRAKLLAALYDKFGEAAGWTPAGGGSAAPVTIRRKTGDVIVGFGESEAVASQDILRVRASEISAPVTGDVVSITGAETLVILGQPRRAKQGLEWICEATLKRT